MLKSSCGSPCWNNYFFPLNNHDSVITRMYVFDIDTVNNNIVYLEEKNYKQLVIENLKSGKKKYIDEPISEVPFIGNMIDSISIHKNQFYLKWFEPNKYNNHKEPKEIFIPKIEYD